MTVTRTTGQDTALTQAVETKPFWARAASRVGQILIMPIIGRFPLYAYLGLMLNIAAWASSWGRIGPWNYTFLPLWVGFILFLDGLNVARTGTSYLTRSFPRFLGLFLFSIPIWWFFEVLNIPLQNWVYILDHQYGWFDYHAFSSINFSTVLPAVLEIAELLTGFAILRPRMDREDVGPRLPVPAAILLIAVGVVGTILPWIFPRYLFGLIWIAPIFVFDPINNLAGMKSVSAHLMKRDFRFFVALPLSALLCGFFWECWNYYALPKWRYDIWLINSFPHLFEMPIIGFLGYLPFALELFVLYHFLLLILGKRKDNMTF